MEALLKPIEEPGFDYIKDVDKAKIWKWHDVVYGCDDIFRKNNIELFKAETSDWDLFVFTQVAETIALGQYVAPVNYTVLNRLNASTIGILNFVFAIRKAAIKAEIYEIAHNCNVFWDFIIKHIMLNDLNTKQNG